VHVIVQRCHNLNRLLAGMMPNEEVGQAVQSKEVGETKQASLFPEARNFK
jgi:hypothetical protein